jgi:hypothetical protein
MFTLKFSDSHIPQGKSDKAWFPLLKESLLSWLSSLTTDKAQNAFVQRPLYGRAIAPPLVVSPQVCLSIDILCSFLSSPKNAVSLFALSRCFF